MKRFGSIRNSMILSFMLLIFIIVLCVSLASYSFTVRDFENLSISNTAILLGAVNFNIDTYIDNMKSMTSVIAGNVDIRNLMAFYNAHHAGALDTGQLLELYNLKQRAAHHMNVVANTRNDITNIAIISKNGDVLLSDIGKEVNGYSSYQQADWFLQPLAHKDDVFVSPSHVQNLVRDEYRWVISISRALIDPASGEITGVVVIDLNYRAIESICENVNMEQTGYIYLMDGARNLIYHPQQQLIYSGIKSENYDAVFGIPEGSNSVRIEQEERLYIRDISDTTGWFAVGVVNTQHLLRMQAGIVRFYILLAYISIVIAGVIAVLIAGAITKPVKQLESTMRKVELGDFSVWSDVRLNNEIGHLSHTFNAMVAQIRRLMDDLVRKESEKRQIEIRSLQAQINPHFLYNTLDTIIWMSASGKNEQVVEVTSALAHLFRTSISQGGSLVELGVEVGNIESYLTIQKMRYKDKLVYEVIAAPDTLCLMTPKLILQPIVENALYHGIKQRDEGGKINITTARAADCLVITVEDNGVGMSEAQLARLLQPRDDDTGGLGVRNVHNRIRLVFGPDYGLTFHSVQGRGTQVTIRLPAVEKGDTDDG